MEEELSAIELAFLIKLVELGFGENWIKTSTTRLSKQTTLSQQTVSRRIRRLVAKGYLERIVVRDGEMIRLTEKARKKILKLHDILSRFASKPIRSINLGGMVVSGLGEGRYYISLNGYRRQFEKKLGFRPFEGTLNIKLLTASDVINRRIIEKHHGIIIKGFSDGTRTYGDVKCFRAEIEELEPAALIIPSRTSHPEDIVEIIAPFNIRNMLGLRDGDIVRIVVYLQ